MEERNFLQWPKIAVAGRVHISADVTGLLQVQIRSRSTRRMRFLFYSHDGLGLGHTRRNLAIASALTALEPRASVLLAVGADYVSRHRLPPRVDILKLPGLRKITNGHYSARHLCIPVEEIRGLRAAMLLTAVKSFAPAVALVDKHPFGAGGEFRDGLRVLKELGGKAVLGLRDILDEPGRVVAGPMAPEGQSHALKRLAAEHRVAFLTFVQHLSGLFGSVDALVCMGGYNTVGEAVSKGVPVVCVPRVEPRSEQWLRATAFERLGLLRVVQPDALSAASLRGAVGTALSQPHDRLLERVREHLSFGGARQAAGRLC